MKVEFIEFYPSHPFPAGGTIGTLRVRLPELGIEIMGIAVTKNKDHWGFYLPGRLGLDHRTQKKVRYPFISFVDKEKHHEMIAAIREGGQAFVEARLKTLEIPSNPSQIARSACEATPPTGQRKNEPVAKETPVMMKARSKEREYVTPPPLKRKVYCNSKK